MASGSQNMTTYNARIVTGSNNAASPAGALLLSGAGRADDATGDTWIFLDSNGGLTNPWGIKHDQANNKLQIFGSGTNSFSVSMDTGDTYILGKVGIGYDPETSGNTYKLYVEGSTRINSTLHIFPNSGNYTEGIRIHSYNSWSDITLCGNDNTEDSGISANSWFIGNNDGDLYIARNGSPGSTAWLECVNNIWSTMNPLWIKGGSTAAGANANRLTTSSGMPGNMQYNTSRRGTQIYSNGIAFADPYNGNSNNDAGWIRHIEETANTGVFEFAVGDDDSNEAIVFRRYTTSNTVGKEVYIFDASGNSSFPGTVTMAGQLYINYNQDVGLNQTGSLIIGSKDGENIGIDGNEIMARNNGAASTLYINSEGGNVYIGSGGITSVGTIASTAGYLKSTVNGNTVQIGSQNTGFCHITNSANIPFWFNKDIYIERGKTIGASGTNYRPFQIYLGRSSTADSKALNSNNPLIEFANNDRSQYGQIIYTDFNNQGGSDSFTFVSNQSDLRIYAPKVYNAVWNDYAETRATDITEPGRVVTENGKIMTLTNERLLPGCRIISDTYGTCMGREEDTPVAVSGRVLVYPYHNRNDYPLGAAVCSAPNGTVDIMTREEIINYPERIIGTVSEIPDYEYWGAGQDGKLQIAVNNRIWIYVR